LKFYKKILLDRSLKYIFAIIYIGFFFPVIALFNQYTNQSNNYISIIYRASTFLISFLIIVKEASNKKSFLGSSIIILIFFWIYYMIKLLYDLFFLNLLQNPNNSIFYYITQTFGISFINLIAFYYAGKKINYKQLAQYLFYFLALLNSVIFFVFIKNHGFNLAEYASMRLGLSSDYTEIEYLNPISIGVYASYLLISLAYYRISFYYLIFFIIGIFNLTVSASQGPVLCLFIFYFFYFIKYDIKMNFKNIIIFIFILILTIFIIYSNVGDEILIIQRILNVDQNESTFQRIEAVNSAYNQIKENIFFGTHYFVVINNSVPHNLFIDIILSTGLVGLILVLVSFFRFLKIIILNYCEYSVMGISFFYFCLTQTSGYVFGLIDFWPLVGLILTYNNVKYKNVYS
jgi:hypothetical protein